MALSERERLLYEKLLRVFELRQPLGSLHKADFSDEDIFHFFNSENSDLNIVGTDLLSLLPEEPDPELFARSPTAARNYVRFRMARTAARSGKFELPTSLLNQSTFRVHFEDLASRLIADQGAGAPAAAPQQGLTVIVHGTWGATSKWWRLGGNFWQYVNGITGNVYAGPNPFSWTGNNNHADRLQGANDLLTWTGGQTFGYLDLIAHSHGGNVCLYASHLGLKIRKLILLGTPIRLEYLPDLSNIQELQNVYSTGDMVQKPGTFPNRRGEGRSLSDAERIRNHCAEDNGSGQNPGHSDLHESATWAANKFDRLL